MTYYDNILDDTDTELAELLPIREDNISETENLSEKQSVESRSSISVTGWLH